jgi:hypothetical protein
LTRKRSLPFESLVFFLTNLLKCVSQYERDSFYDQLFESEQWVEIARFAKAGRDCLRNGLDASPLRGRLIRTELPNGEVEVLMTSLGNAIPGCEFAALYHLRRDIEEASKLHKCRGELEKFSGKTVRLVYQGLHAKLLTRNLAAMCAFAAEDQALAAVAHRKHPYRVKRTKALSKVKYHLVCALLNMQERLYRLFRLDWRRCRGRAPRSQL